MKHWTNKEYIDWIYGLREDAAHLDECQECREHAAEVRRRRGESIREPDVTWEFLAAQRRSIYQRMEMGHSAMRLKWMVSVAMLVVVAVLTFNVWRGTRNEFAPLSTPADDKLYSDLVTIEQSNEPRAIRPIEKLFQE